MNFSSHTIYFDITQRCEIGCTFCMYANRRNGLELHLTDTGRANVSRILSSKNIKRISISGEGEPLNNLHTIWDVLSLSGGEQNFEIITSGAFPPGQFFAFLEKLDAVLASKKDKCNVRISSDSYHIAKIPYIPHGASIQYFLEKRPQNISLSFRSIDTDRELTRDFLLNELRQTGNTGDIIRIDSLDDELHVSDYIFNIAYKNVVHPEKLQLHSYMTLYDYIDALEEKNQRPFTFGSMNPYPLANGMDVTIKPDGNVFFYGIEPYELGNIQKDDIDLHKLQELLEATPQISKLYTTPFKSILERLSANPDIDSIIQKANNPYWVLQDICMNRGREVIEDALQ